MCLGEGRGLSRSQESHLHWRQHDTQLPAQVQAHFDPLAVCGVGVSVEVTEGSQTRIMQVHDKF